MTRQEEIREGIRKILDSPGYGYNWETADDTKSRINRIDTNRILSYLHSQGVVIWQENTLTTEPLLEEAVNNAKINT